MERKLSLKSAAEWSGARKVIAALKRARKLKGGVKLAPNPAGKTRRVRRYPKPRYRPTAEQWARMGPLLQQAKRLANGRRRNVAAGFVDEDGVFHPIRASFDYSRSRAGEGRKRGGGKKKKGARKRNTTYASFQRQGRRRGKKKNPVRLSKKQEFIRRMRLGRLRAARRRARR